MDQVVEPRPIRVFLVDDHVVVRRGGQSLYVNLSRSANGRIGLSSANFTQSSISAFTDSSIASISFSPTRRRSRWAR